MLRIAFAGTPQFAVPALEALAASPHPLVGVLTQPDRPSGRGQRERSSPVKTLALALGLPLSQPQHLHSPQELAALVSWAPELLVVVAYGLILPPAVLALPRLGCINVHASLLPRWRGAAPIQHAILAGDTETGVSIMQLDAGLDTGPVLAREPMAIPPAATAEQLAQGLSELGARLLLPTIDALEAGHTHREPQAEQDATYARKIDKSLAQIDWALPADHIARQVRALNPRPVAQSSWSGVQLRIWEAGVVPAARARELIESLRGAVVAVPGTILALDAGTLAVLCGEGVLAIARLQLPGRRVISAGEFANAHAAIGARLGT